MRVHVGKGDREHDLEEDDETQDAHQETAWIAPTPTFVQSPRAPERPDADGDEQRPGGDHEQAGVVVSRRSHLDGVVARLGGAADEGEEAGAVSAMMARKPARRRGYTDAASTSTASGTNPLTVIPRPRYPAAAGGEVVVQDVDADDADADEVEGGLAANGNSGRGKDARCSG